MTRYSATATIPGFFSRPFAFVFCFFLGIGSFYLLAPTSIAPLRTSVPPIISSTAVPEPTGTGSAFCGGPYPVFDEGFSWETDESKGKLKGKTTGLRIVSQPKAAYTDEARQNTKEGSVLLKVTFLASGNVGAIKVIRGLPDGKRDICSLSNQIRAKEGKR